MFLNKWVRVVATHYVNRRAWESNNIMKILRCKILSTLFAYAPTIMTSAALFYETTFASGILFWSDTHLRYP